MESNKNKTTKDTQETQGKKKSRPTRLIPDVVFTLAIIFVVYFTISTLVQEEKEHNAWGEAISSMSEQDGSSCDILRVSNINKTFQPKGTKLEVQYYIEGGLLSFKRKLDNYTEISIKDTEVKVPQIKNGNYLKVCSSAEGYLETLEVVDIHK